MNIKNKKSPALFLDRDGVVIEDHGYVGNADDVQIISGILPVLEFATAQKIPIVILTNQSGVARGYYSLRDCELVHKAIDSELSKFNIKIAAWYICPHHAEHGVGIYKKDCDCRKPAPGLMLQAQVDLNIEIANSLMVGDKKSDVLDIEGPTTILVKGKYDLNDLPSSVKVTDHKNLLALVQEFFL